MPISLGMQQQLWGENPPIEEADEILISEGYQFIGYHGTNNESLKLMVAYNLNEERMGTGSGQVKGPGFYVGWQYSLARDYAEAATQAGDPDLISGNIPFYEGDKGKPCILRLYAKNFEGMKLGKDYTWGVQSSDGDPNGDRGVIATHGRDYENLSHDLEFVFRPHVYRQLAVIPAGAQTLEARLNRRAHWNSHDYMGQNPMMYEKKSPLKRNKSNSK